jgi:tetratricopeptide (TPR) repeat protein
MTREEIKTKEKQLLMMVGDFTRDNINEEYTELCRNLVKKLGRKHDVPFKRGKLEIWASAVVYAIGQINFLFDKSFEPYLTPDDICNYFNTKKSTVSSKAKTIRDILKLEYYDKEFSTGKMIENNPLNNFVMTEEGIIVPKSMLFEEKSFLDLLEEQNGLDKEIIKETLVEAFLQKKENIDEKKVENFIKILTSPISEEDDDTLKAIFSVLDDLDPTPDEEDDIELFEDYVIDDDNPLETIEDYQRAIDLFRSTKGEKYFEENKGYFWGMLESRPFMMHLLEQAMLLWDAGQRDRAVSQLQYLLELNPNDNQGVRYVLMSRLLELDRLDEAQELFDFYDEEYSADWLFSKLLLSIKSNQNKDIIEELYEEAVEENEFIIPFLVGKKKIPKVLPSFYSPGDENEAIIYVDLAQRAWKNNKKAIKMLKKFNKIK